VLKPNDWKPPLIAAIGMGAGLEWLGALATEWICNAQVLIGGKRHLELFPDHPGERLPFKSPMAESVEEIGRLSETRRVAVLCSGDPLFFGLGRTLADRFGKERLVIIPNITSVQSLCARICEGSDSVDVVSFHGRTGETGIERVLEILERGRKAAIITDPAHTPQWLARELIESGRGCCELIIGEDLGTASERVRSLSPSDATGKEFSALNVILVKPSDAALKAHEIDRPQMIFGFGEDAFEREAGMITKMEVRAVVLALLQLQHGQILWDLGAATGSISVEAARIARLKSVYAIERNQSRYSKLVRNLEKFHASRIEAECARASQAIHALPAPDRVFIGGSGDDLDSILEVVAQKLLPGGRIVQTIVTIQTLEKVSAFWKEKNFELSMVQLQVSRSVPVGKDARFEALNPVFIVSAWKNSDQQTKAP
jgi:precorrin-6Y C5,15-methyltransferase (decarboxylating)